MQALMMDQPLIISSILKHAEKNFADREIVSVTCDNPLHRYNYADLSARTRRLASALMKLGLETGDRVATLAWNDYRHLELYFAVSGAGLVCHTVNPRLFPEQVAYILEHAEDQWIFVDPLVVPLLEALQGKLGKVKGYVILTDDEHLPEHTLNNAMSYEALLESGDDHFDWPILDENLAAGLCYTSGTTGNPKGVLYSHRSNLLHAYAISMPDVMCLSTRDSILPVVPLFHVNAWGTPFAALMVGAKLVLPGPKMGDGETLCRLMNQEQVTLALGVPTVWMLLLRYLQESGSKLETLNRTVIGGAAVPESMIREFELQHKVDVIQGWGMTETSPLGVINTPKAESSAESQEDSIKRKCKAGRGIYGVEMRIVDDQQQELPWDGQAFGRLQVRGAWVCKAYYGDVESAHTDDGWFDTGDVATIDPQGYMAITDRTKDVIKSGGEWISSIDVENEVMGHEAVAEAAVIGVPHPKWTERPLLIVILNEGAELSAKDLLAWLEGKIARWWIPDAVEFVDEIPHTATGKVKKVTLREQFADYQLPE